MRLTIAVVASLAAASEAGADVSFELMTVPHVFVTGMSSDGQWVTGMSAINNDVYRYHVASQSYDFITTNSTPFGLPDISNDGQRIVANFTNKIGVNVAGIWTSGSGWQAIPELPNTIVQDGANGGGFGISGDGTMATGLFITSDANGVNAFRWSQGGGSSVLTDQGTGARGSKMNADGSVVGGFTHANPGGHRQATVWRNGVMANLSPDRWGDIEGVNSSGDVVVGNGDKSFGEGAMRWDWDGTDWTATNLGVLAGTDLSFYNVSALDASSAGDMIVGVNRSGVGPLADADGFFWTAETGMVDLELYLDGLGVDYGNFDIEVATAVSDDGMTISGWGTDLDTFERKGYIITISNPSECLADVNGDGTVSPTDFTAWIAAFNAMAPECDQNGDGSCTPADFTAWIANFNAGC